MRTPRPAAIAATFSFAAFLAVSGLPSGPGEATAHDRSQSADLAALRACESGGSYRANTGNGYYGAYQFSAATWQSLGYRGLPNAAAPEVQDEAALRLASIEGWSHWPACARSLGLRGKPASPPARLRVAPAAPVVKPEPAPAPAAPGREVGRALLRLTG